MRKIYIYILAVLALSVACQRAELPEDSQVNQSTQLPTGAIGSKATITFSTADLMTVPETRGVLTPVDPVINPTNDVKTLHLIVFDENGMLVEVCQAEKAGSSDHDDHQGGRYYTVTLTVTDQPRTIHYVANCPVDQVVYGHETSIIGNMFVDRNDSEGAQTKYETSYWARIEVPYILVEEQEVVQSDGTKKIVVSLVDAIKDKFMHVPLVRNYAEITVTNAITDNTFHFIGFTVYNLLDRGTVAPYNSNTQKFQSFFEYTSDGGIRNYSYPEISDFGHEGHTLTSAQLITDFVRNDDGKVRIFASNEPFYVYERKVSVMTDEEEKWRESPPHIIIKGRYNQGKEVDTLRSPIYYYKMDLVYTEKDNQGFEEIKYYNILRNFMYQFNITAVHDVGYTSLDQAVAGAAGNNISGSSSTSKLTNISDNDGRLWVSHTDTTLVARKDIVLRYKYIPNYYDNTKPDYNQVNNGQARFENIVGEVITGIVVADRDIEGGTWDGYREVTISVNEPTKITRQQILSLKTNSAHLNRQIRYTLREKLTMQVEATPKVSGKIMEKVTVDIKLPIGMTEDMFPLKLDMETFNRTLSPDATLNSIPVTAGPSIIEDRNGALSYYYTVTIPTLDAYKALPDDGNMKVVTTHWLTNMAANASTFYVANKYFNQAYDSWENYKYEFSNAACSSSAVGVGENVTISFNMDSGDNAYNRPVKISLEGMTTSDGATELLYTPTSRTVSIGGFKTTTATDRVSFTLDAEEYNIEGPVVGERQTYKFNGAFVDVTSLETEADVEVDFTFNISADALEALRDLYPDAGDAGVPMFVILDRLHPADDQLVYSQARAEGDRYIYRIKQAGKQTIKLATTDAAVGLCTVTLQADYFDTQSVEILQSNVFATAEFREWSGTNTDYVIVGQTVRYYVNVSSSSKPTSVTIDGKNATQYTVNNAPEGTTVWYIDWSGSAKENHAMNVEMVVEGTTFTNKVGEIKVAGWTIGSNSTTSLDTTGNTLYVLKNRGFSSTYLTAVNENKLAANTSQNYYNLFTVRDKKIVSVARNMQLKSSNSNNSDITFDTTGTDYTFTVQNTSYMRISYTYNSGWNTYTNYIRESSEGTVQSSTSTNNNRSDWQFYPVTIDIP